MSDRFFPSVGNTLAGKYQLTRELGRGSMGAVFEATHLRLAQRMAIKVLLPWVAEHPELAYRFEHEARAAARLRGGHTVRVFDVDTSPEGLPFLVMEYLKGRCLRRELARRGRLPVDEAVRYVLDACEGMCEVHAAGIIHRDLKPSNLFLSEEGDRRVVKVLDFGVAKLLGDGVAKVLGNGDANHQTATDTHLGTYKYMSPEHARSARSVDARSDIWSLGVVLYQLLAGSAPFDGDDAISTLVSIVTQEPPSLLAWRRDVPAGLVAVIERALCKDAGGRYQTMRDFFDALAPFGPAREPLSIPSASPSVSPSVPMNEPSWHVGASPLSLSHSGASSSLASEDFLVVRSSRPEGSVEVSWPRPLRKMFTGLAHLGGVALVVLTTGVSGGWWFVRSGPPASAAALPFTTPGGGVPLPQVTPMGSAAAAGSAAAPGSAVAAAPADAASPPNVERPPPAVVGQAEVAQDTAPNRATPLPSKAPLVGRWPKRTSPPAPPPALPPNDVSVDVSVAAPAASSHAAKASVAVAHHLLPVDDAGPNGASSKHRVLE